MDRWLRNEMAPGDSLTIESVGCSRHVFPLSSFEGLEGLGMVGMDWLSSSSADLSVWHFLVHHMRYKRMIESWKLCVIFLSIWVGCTGATQCDLTTSHDMCAERSYVRPID